MKTEAETGVTYLIAKGYLETPQAGKRQGTEFRLEPLKRIELYQHLDFGVLTSRTVRE